MLESRRCSGTDPPQADWSAKPWMAQRSQHRASGGLEGRSKRPGWGMGDPEPTRDTDTQVDNLCYWDRKGTQVENLCYGDRTGPQVTNLRLRIGTVTLFSLPRLPLLAGRRRGPVGR